MGKDEVKMLLRDRSSKASPEVWRAVDHIGHTDLGADVEVGGERLSKRQEEAPLGKR
jgi:hypothetical protein